MAQHSQEVLDEDDAFLGRAGTEVWEYEIVNDRASEFEDALKNSQTVMEFEVIDAEMTEQDEAGNDVPHGDTGQIRRISWITTEIRGAAVVEAYRRVIPVPELTILASSARTILDWG